MGPGSERPFVRNWAIGMGFEQCTQFRDLVWSILEARRRPGRETYPHISAGYDRSTIPRASLDRFTPCRSAEYR